MKRRRHLAGVILKSRSLVATALGGVALAAAVIAALLTPCVSSLAEEGPTAPAWMSGDEIRAEFSRKHMAGIYPSRNLWTESIHGDGTTDYREGANHWRGRWWVEGRLFCFSYPPPGLGGCFQVVRHSANCFEIYEYRSQPPDAGAPLGNNRWNGRMWHADKPTTCEEQPNV